MASPGRDESDSQWMDNYRIAAQIGSGKYSDVFMVFTQDAEAYAMKIMKVIPEKGDGPAVDLTGIPHVLQEIRPDKNSPSLYTGEADGKRRVQIFPLLFKPITGNELLELQDECKVDILKQIAETYNAAAKKGIYHRNLDPTNVLVDRWTVTPTEATVFVIGWSYTVLKNMSGGQKASFEVGLTRWRYPEFEHLTDPSGNQSTAPVVDTRWRFCCFAYWLMTGEDPILPEHPDPCCYVDPGTIKAKASYTGFIQQCDKKMQQCEKKKDTLEKVKKQLEGLTKNTDPNVSVITMWESPPQQKCET